MSTKSKSQKPQKVKKQVTYTMGERALERLKKEVTDDAVRKAFILILAYIMDELDYDPEKLVEIYNGVDRYCHAMDEHLISANKVCEIIRNSTGADIRW